MKPLEKIETMPDQPHEDADLLAQLSEARARAEEDLRGGHDEALAEGVRRAEAILFAAGEPLSAAQISQVLPQGIEPAEVLMALRAAYARRGVNLVEVAGKWRFQTAAELSWLFVEERQVQKKLGQAALETLAIVAYGQPVTRAEIEAVRGVAVSKATIDTLLETGWIRTRGRRRTPGLPVLYGTTEKFLEHFGLESLDTLPGKADLEAEGLLSDVIPDGFQMPDEAALSEDDLAMLAGPDSVEADNFVTDYLEDTVQAGPLTDDDSPLRQEAESHDDLASDDDGADKANPVSLFDYTRSLPSEAEPDTDAADFGQDSIKAAVLRLRTQSRIPQQPMDSWSEDE